MAVAAVAAAMEEVVDTEEDAVVAVVEVSQICTLFPCSIADGTNKDAGRRFHLF